MARLVETLALASVERSTQKVYRSKLQTRCRMRTVDGNSPWWAENNEIDAADKGVDKFHCPAMLCVQKPKPNDPRIFRWNKNVHKMFGRWENESIERTESLTYAPG